MTDYNGFPFNTEPQPEFYRAGTNVRDIKHFDRGTKVTVKCIHHPEIQYRTKEWGRSNEFPANEHTQRAELGIDVMECDHKFRDDVWVLAEDYEA